MVLEDHHLSGNRRSYWYATRSACDHTGQSRGDDSRDGEEASTLSSAKPFEVHDALQLALVVDIGEVVRIKDAQQNGQVDMQVDEGIFREESLDRICTVSKISW